jgi:hypothetical protein
METLIIKPQIVNNQYWFTLPNDLEEQELEFVLKIHYKPKKEEQKKEFWFLNLKGIDINNHSFRREDMYDDWGR